MTKWEYKHVAAGHSWEWLGEEGWELVVMDGNGRAHFKRPIEPEPEPPPKVMPKKK